MGVKQKVYKGGNNRKVLHGAGVINLIFSPENQ
jgi:hypothetical protein